MPKHVVALAEEIAPGTRKLVTVRGREIVIFNREGEYFALLNKCPHQCAQLCHGKLIGLVESDKPGVYRHSQPGTILRCPWHGWEFDIRTGKSHLNPDRTFTRTYPVDVESGRDLVDAPLVAETFRVSVEGEYVVVTV